MIRIRSTGQLIYTHLLMVTHYFSLLYSKLITMSLFQEFKSFAMRGNILDLAVAVIIGAAFGSIVSSLVDDIITPLLLTPAMEAAGVKEIASLKWGEVKYGNFLAAVIKFISVAFVLFMLIKGFNALQKKKKEDIPAGPSSTDALLTEIRDLLNQKKP